MSAGLQDRLDRVAREAPAGPPPGDLWRRGVRRRRRRVAGGVVAALLAVVAGGGLAGTAARSVRLDPGPADATGAAIPSRLVEPSPWTPGTDKLGPPGKLAVVIGAERATGLLGATSNGIVGVSSGTGAYRFLDVPGMLSTDLSTLGADALVALSPEGGSVAYWLGSDDVVRGVAVYDTATGEVTRKRIPSRLGLAPQTLAWVDDDTVLLRYGVITQRDASSMSSNLGPALLWSPSDGATAELDADASDPVAGVAVTEGGFSTWDGAALAIWTKAGESRYSRRAVEVRGLAEGATTGDLALSPGGQRVAVTAGDGPDGRNALHVGALRPADRSVTVRTLRVTPAGGRVDLDEVLGWQDAEHVLVSATIGSRSGVFVVDARGGSSERIVAAPPSTYSPGRFYAADLWSDPTVDRPVPADAPDPRVVAGGGGLVVLLLLGAGALAVRRRRGRA